MSDRDQLLELRGKVARKIHLDGSEFTLEDIKFIDRLLARWPYEPGEEIEVCTHPYNKWKRAVFYSVCPYDQSAVMALLNDTQEIHSWAANRHRPLPRTITLEVPEEKIELAHEALADIGAHSESYRKAMKVCQWLAREAGEGE